MREPWTFTVEQVFAITGRGTAVIGTLAGGDIHGGDSAALTDGSRVEDVFVEFHSPPGKVSLMLPGVDKAEVPKGSVLTGPA